MGALMCTGVLVTGNCCGLCSKGHICAPREAAAYQHLLPHQQSVPKQQKDVTAAQGSSTHVSFLEQGACRAVAIAAIKHALGADLSAAVLQGAACGARGTQPLSVRCQPATAPAGPQRCRGCQLSRLPEHR